jgi:hypothetical protein
LNTYKAAGIENVCIPCPQHSHTTAAAQLLGGCVCDEGYAGPAGGPCEDVDECTRGPCSDLCTNTDGGYDCHYAIPGYVLDPLDRHTCISESSFFIHHCFDADHFAEDEECRNLTLADAPQNGGLVCHWYTEQNSQQCSVNCNPNYGFPSGVNNYETCGPTTDYIWTHEREDTALLG